MINISKPVITKKGQRVIGLCCVPMNSCGEMVTYPIKGSIIVKEKPLKLEYCIWSDKGEYDVVWHKHSMKNIINA